MFKNMQADEYINRRVEQFQSWYDAKAVRAKTADLIIRTAAVVGAVIVPVIANLTVPGLEPYKIGAITIISLMVSLAVVLDGVYHFGDQWRNYRSTEQFLSREKFLFQTGKGPYIDLDAEAAFVLFIERCEAQIFAENSATLNVIATAAQLTRTASKKLS
jgi:hypothetical protein